MPGIFDLSPVPGGQAVQAMPIIVCLIARAARTRTRSCRTSTAFGSITGKGPSRRWPGFST